MKEILCRVYGNVQGVSYRSFIRQKAGEFNVTGTAENMPDGTVEIVAQGKEGDVRKLLDYIYSGTDEAEVESVNVQWGPVTEPLTDFKIF